MDNTKFERDESSNEPSDGKEEEALVDKQGAKNKLHQAHDKGIIINPDIAEWLTEAGFEAELPALLAELDSQAKTMKNLYASQLAWAMKQGPLQYHAAVTILTKVSSAPNMPDSMVSQSCTNEDKSKVDEVSVVEKNSCKNAGDAAEKKLDCKVKTTYISCDQPGVYFSEHAVFGFWKYGKPTKHAFFFQPKTAEGFVIAHFFKDNQVTNPLYIVDVLNFDLKMLSKLVVSYSKVFKELIEVKEQKKPSSYSAALTLVLNSLPKKEYQWSTGFDI